MAQILSCRELSLVRVDARGQERVILDRVHADFMPGKLHLITGSIGAGKTSLLHLLSTLLRPTSGEVLAGQEPISRYSAAHRDRWRRQVGLAFQNPHFLAGMSALENVMVPLIPTASSLAQARDAAMAQLESLEAGHLAGRGVGSLSGGERQRVILARALVRQPSYLFADEPTAHQDPEGALALMRRLGQERDRGALVLMVSHDKVAREAAQVDQRWHLEAGRLEPLP